MRNGEPETGKVRVNGYHFDDVDGAMSPSDLRI